MTKDYTFEVSYEPALRKLEPPVVRGELGPPMVKLTNSVNMDVTCREGKIQLRKYPTGILVEEQVCIHSYVPYRRDSRCMVMCPLSPAWSHLMLDDEHALTERDIQSCVDFEKLYTGSWEEDDDD